MSWLLLVLAGLAEIGWPIGMKMAQRPESRILGIAVSVGFMIISGVLLYLAQRNIAMGTAYAVWTGIGAIGTFAVGVLFYGDPSGFVRYLGVALILGGVVTLRLAD